MYKYENPISYYNANNIQNKTGIISKFVKVKLKIEDCLE